jgi:hypothetical protein
MRAEFADSLSVVQAMRKMAVHAEAHGGSTGS